MPMFCATLVQFLVYVSAAHAFNCCSTANDRRTSVSLNAISRRQAMTTAVGGFTAELAWRTMVEDAAMALETSSEMSILRPGALKQIEAGKAVVIPNWLTSAETRALCGDAQQCFQQGAFTNFILSRNPKKADKFANDRWIMPSFGRGLADGPFMDSNFGNLVIRNNLKQKMAQIKAELAKGLTDRPTLAGDLAQTHESEYLRYGQGALLNRHTDEHHLELKRPHGSRLPLKPNASRRSITWLVYLNDEWNDEDGGQLRLHERAYEAVAPVGARKNDLQVGWLRAIPSQGLPEQPVFLDTYQNDNDADENESCKLYTFDANGSKRFLSKRPFANISLYLGGGDKMARSLMVEQQEDKERFHLIDAPKNLVAEVLKTEPPPAGEDGGEKIRDILPKAGTLVMFDSVSLPHEVLTTNRERFGVQGWFHEIIEKS